MSFMEWSECEEKFLRDVSPDKNKIKSMLDIAGSRQKFIETLAVNENSVSFITEGYYETIKELLVALLLTKGLRSSNHQCLITYFYLNYKEHESYAHLMSELSYLRNRLEYYGEQIIPDFYNKNINKMKALIKILKEIIKKQA